MTGISWRALLVGAVVLLAAACGSDAGGEPSGATGGSDPSSNAAIAVMPIGDSITAGPYYRPHLVRTLAGAGCGVDFVGTFTGAGDLQADDAAELDLDHQAVGGATSGEISAQIGGWLQQEPPPDVALIHLGTNDFFAGIDRATTIANVEAIIGVLRERNPEVAVVLAQILPAGGVESGVAALNARLAVVAQRLSTAASPITVVDMAAGIDVEDDLVDGVHPNEDEAIEMAARWTDALGPLLADRCQL